MTLTRDDFNAGGPAWGYLVEFDDAPDHHDVNFHGTVSTLSPHGTDPYQTPKKKLVINSPVHGKITPTRFKKLLKEHGSKRAMAHALGISEGTLQSWKKKLGL